MSRRFVCLSVFATLPLVLASVCRAQDQTKLPSAPSKAVSGQEKATSASDALFAKEGVVYEKVATVIHYDAEGLGDKTLTVEARIQSEGAVHEAGLLTFAYASGEEQLEPVYVRVRRPDGTVVETPATDAQDMPTEVTREAPFYSDLRELQIPVKSLSVGDKLEYQVKYVRKKTAATGQFWGALNFIRSNVVLEETVELSFPKDKYVQVLDPGDKARNYRGERAEGLSVEDVAARADGWRGQKERCGRSRQTGVGRMDDVQELAGSWRVVWVAGEGSRGAER